LYVDRTREHCEITYARPVDTESDQLHYTYSWFNVFGVPEDDDS